MGKASREKGKRGERELAGRLREYGYDARRGQQYSGMDGDDVVGLPGIHIECKRVERLDLYAAMDQAARLFAAVGARSAAGQLHIGRNRSMLLWMQKR